MPATTKSLIVATTPAPAHWHEKLGIRKASGDLNAYLKRMLAHDVVDRVYLYDAQPTRMRRACAAHFEGIPVSLTNAPMDGCLCYVHLDEDQLTYRVSFYN